MSKTVVLRITENEGRLFLDSGNNYKHVVINSVQVRPYDNTYEYGIFFKMSSLNILDNTGLNALPLLYTTYECIWVPNLQIELKTGFKDYIDYQILESDGGLAPFGQPNIVDITIVLTFI